MINIGKYKNLYNHGEVMTEKGLTVKRSLPTILFYAVFYTSGLRKNMPSVTIKERSRLVLFQSISAESTTARPIWIQLQVSYILSVIISVIIRTFTDCSERIVNAARLIS